MDPVKLELLVELAVVLLAPPIYQYHLWRQGKTDKAGLIKTAKVFAPFTCWCSSRWWPGRGLEF